MIVATNGSRIGSIKTLILPTPAAQAMNCNRNRTARKLTDIEFLNVS